MFQNHYFLYSFLDLEEARECRVYFLLNVSFQTTTNVGPNVTTKVGLKMLTHVGRNMANLTAALRLIGTLLIQQIMPKLLLDDPKVTIG